MTFKGPFHLRLVYDNKKCTSDYLVYIQLLLVVCKASYRAVFRERLECTTDRNGSKNKVRLFRATS